jgi:3-deoxy-D-manno-octulosonic-acid transferase
MMLWFLYNILFVIGFIVLLPRFFYRMCRRGGYGRHFWQRLGFYGRDVSRQLREGSWVWIQAVSVGEVFVAFRFMEEMRSRHPELRFVLSTTTSTGHAIARKKVSDDDVLIYFPVDFPLVTKHVLDIIRPKVLILVECELWPNLMRLSKRRGIPVVLVNGRISEHSYQGYRKLRMFTRRILPLVDLLCVQSEQDREKLIELGGSPEQLKVMGSAKYEVAQSDPAAEEKAREILDKAGLRDGKLILLGGSTWPGEEAILLDLYRAMHARHGNLALVLAPRHVERTGEVLKEIEARGLTVLQRSHVGDETAAEAADVFLIDTTGELKSFYAHATVIFIGKSLTQHGGQNIIEPALYGKPIIVGPNMENFPVVIEDFRSAKAIVQVSGPEGLEKAVADLLGSEEERAAYGDRAAQLVRDKAGAVEATVEMIDPIVK